MLAKLWLSKCRAMNQKFLMWAVFSCDSNLQTGFLKIKIQVTHFMACIGLKNLASVSYGLWLTRFFYTFSAIKEKAVCRSSDPVLEILVSGLESEFSSSFCRSRLTTYADM